MYKLDKSFWSFLLWVLGWKIIRPEDLERRGVVAVAPHTSYWDGVIGYIAMKAMKINFKVISAEWLFFFPFKYVMKYVMHAIPCGPHSGNSIRVATKLFKEEKDVNLIICPEGQLAPTSKWNKGFHTIAKIADVPVTLTILNFKKKTIQFVAPFDVNDKSKWNSTATDANRLLEYYSELVSDLGYAKHPEKFLKHKCN